jgi:pimeloyl-ACP methyl ester carboxylesterase
MGPAPSEPVHRAEATTGYAPVNGLDMYYEVHGDGSPLVLLHGAMGTIGSCFGELLPALALRRRVVATELQGHGHTADVDRPLSYEQMAEDVVALLGALDLEAADFVGYSMGGGVALEIAMRHPHMVRRLVVAGGACYDPRGLYPELFEAVSTAIDDLHGSIWHRAYVAVAPRPDAWPALVAKVGELDRTFGGWPAERLLAVTVPTLLVVGDSDIVRPEHVVEMFRLLGGGVPGDIVGLASSQLAILPGTSHEGLLRRVDWLGSMIASFLDPASSNLRMH